MPLTSHLAGRGVLDVTLEQLGCALPWEAVYRVRPRPELSCTGCGRPMHAKVSGTGSRFFAHDRRSPACPATGETEEHRSLKRALAAAARTAGHHAELEVTAAHRGWRADVLATGPNGRRTALEAQVSSASLDDVLTRTRRYQDDEVDVVWFTHRATHWLNQVPAVRLRRPAAPHSSWTQTHELLSHFSVACCSEVCQPSPPWHGPFHAGWSHATDTSLDEFVIDMLHGRLLPRTTTGPGTRYNGWTTPTDLQAAADYAAGTGAPTGTPWP
uniref:competence protein CoiA family protein n=1 Tax=Streptomyces europaeiscabiei TaxID=146819 RepID=UPI0038D3B52E